MNSANHLSRVDVGVGIHAIDTMIRLPHDTEAATRATIWAREEQTLMVGDSDDRYSEVEVLLQFIDFGITSSSFPEKLTGEPDLLKSRPRMFREFKFRLIAGTLRSLGVNGAANASSSALASA
jgi:hypothetical protein